MSVNPERAEAVSPGSFPSGTVTFAFTDIEGSTRRWERDPAAMQDVVRRHDLLVRTAIEEHGGHVFKTIGDAFCSSFRRPEDAVAAMITAQRRLADEDFSSVAGLPVRAAVHSGTADERGGDYFGPVVNRVARLLAIGHGGQVLVSGVTSDLLGSALPAHASLLHLGEHRLKDLASPERVYQVCAPGLAAAFPPLRSLNALVNNLPALPSSFVGRESELAGVTGLLAHHRLVTLVGSGGIGKTRLALEVAANIADRSPDGVWFIELAPLASGAYIPSTVAQAVGLTLPSNGDPAANLVRALKEKRALFVFDNCEHVIEAAAAVIAALLHECSNVRVLATSRQALWIAGETTYRLPPLEVPAAVGLFVERARAADDRFTLSDENAPAIAEICRRIDGIPLAVELAAARVRVLSPRQIQERLDERFRVLTGGVRDALPRQQTLRALIDWSYDLLSDRERALFRRLGIYVNGFTLEGAAAVGCGEDLDEFEVVDELASLVDKSLVLSEPNGDALRYRLLESTRYYAAEKLDAVGERDACARRRLRYLRDRFAGLRAAAERTARAGDVDTVFASELEDIRAALDGPSEAADTLRAELLAEIGWSWSRLGLEREGEARIEATLTTLATSETLLAARLYGSLARIFRDEGRSARAFEVASEGLAPARASGAGAVLAEMLHVYSTCARQMRSFDEAQAALDEADGIAGLSTALRLRLLSARANLSTQRGDFAAAARGHEQLREEHRQLGNARGERVAALSLAEAEHARGQTQRAIAIVREALPGFEGDSDTKLLANVLANLAGYLAAAGDCAGAAAAARSAIGKLAAAEPDATYVTAALEHLALTLAQCGDLPRAALLSGYVDAAFRRDGVTRETTERVTSERLKTCLSEGLAAADLAQLFAEGEALTAEEAVARGLMDP